MNFFEHRFDFLRVANPSYNPVNAPTFEGYLVASQTYCLPVKKDTVTIPTIRNIHHWR